MSVAKYASHRKVSRQAVYRAIREQRLSAIVQEGKTWIDQEVADEEWLICSISNEVHELITLPSNEEVEAVLREAEDMAPLFLLPDEKQLEVVSRWVLKYQNTIADLIITKQPVERLVRLVMELLAWHSFKWKCY